MKKEEDALRKRWRIKYIHATAAKWRLVVRAVTLQKPRAVAHCFFFYAHYLEIRN